MRNGGKLIALLAGLTVLFALAIDPAAAQQDLRRWVSLLKDGLHDPNNRAVRLLQEPAEALVRLAPDTAGNQVRWVRALAEGQIQPRSNIQPGTNIRTRDSVLLLNLKGGTPIVRFPHFEHTQWLDCSNCHDSLFAQEIGKTPLNMRNILQGEQCGLCHGAVSFPLTECARCHNTPRKQGERYETGAMILTPASEK